MPSLGPSNTALIVAILETVVLAGLFYGFYLIRVKRDRRAHEKNQTIFVLVNLVLIAAMAMGFVRYVIGDSARTPLLRQSMIGHAISGTIIQLLAIFLVLRMKNLVPAFLRTKRYKLLMQITLALWTLQTMGGMYIYLGQYLGVGVSSSPSPVALLQFQSNDLMIHVEEVQAAARGVNLALTKRHGERVINLLAGKNSADYGDLDSNGMVEDPGDGVGLIHRLNAVREDAAQRGGAGARAAQVAERVRDALIRILASTKTIMGANDAAGLNAASAQLAEIGQLAAQVNQGKENSLPQIAALLGESTAMPPIRVEGELAGAGTVNVKDFVYAPKELAIKKGAMVTFVNLDQARHTVTADDRKFSSGDIGAGKTWTMTFNDVGTFPYYCEYHGDRGGVDMAGKIVVQH